jgi:hypothetical protein
MGRKIAQRDPADNTDRRGAVMWVALLLLAAASSVASAAPEVAPRHLTTLGTGVVLGGMLGPTQLTSGFSPSLTLGYEYGRGNLRAYVGAYSAPTFLFVAGNEAFGAPLLVADLGFSVGSEHFRVGPFGSVGLLAAGGGVRAVLTPFDTRRGDLRGFEARLTMYAPRAGSVGVSYVHAFLPPRDDAAGWTARPAGDGPCGRLGLAVGGALTVSSTARSWDFVGLDTPAEVGGSFALAVACESAGRSGGWHLGGEMAPLASYRMPTVDGGADRTVYHMGSLTVGAFVGGDRFRVGPIATAGVWALGAGLRTVFTTAEADDGTHHGIELRALALYPSAPAGEVMALYHLWFDPR